MLVGVKRGVHAFQEARRGERRRALLLSELERHGIDRNKSGLLLSHGIGDHLIAMGLAAAFEQARGETLSYVVGRADLAFLANLYAPQRPYVALPDGLDARAFEYDASGTRPFYAHFPGYHLASMIGYRDLTLMDAYRCRLGLPADAVPELPRAPRDSEVERAKTSLLDRGLRPGRTILLCTKSRSLRCSGLIDQLWMPLAAQLRSEGFDIEVNDDPELSDRLSLPRHDPLPLDQWRAAVAACGHVITFRSGLSELALNTGARHAVVFPHISHLNVIEGYALAQCWNEDIFEIEVDSHDMDKMIAELLAYHQEGQQERLDERTERATAPSPTPLS